MSNTMMTRERALEILELHKTSPQPAQLVEIAIRTLANIKPPEES